MVKRMDEIVIYNNTMEAIGKHIANPPDDDISYEVIDAYLRETYNLHYKNSFNDGFECYDTYTVNCEKSYLLFLLRWSDA